MKIKALKILSLMLSLALIISVCSFPISTSAATANELINSINSLEAQSKKLESEIKALQNQIN